MTKAGYCNHCKKVPFDFRSAQKIACYTKDQRRKRGLAEVEDSPPVATGVTVISVSLRVLSRLRRRVSDTQDGTALQYWILHGPGQTGLGPLGLPSRLH